MFIRGTSSCKRMSMLAVSLVLVLIIGMFSGCAKKSRENKKVSAETAQVVIPVDSEFMQGNIWSTGGGPSSSIMYEGLITKNRKGSYDGWLAESWKASEDAKVWTFKLVKDAEWHDGEAFTSEDVKFTHDFLKTRKVFLSSVLAGVDRVECPDKNTAVFYLKASNPAFLDDLSHCPGIPIVPKHIWQDVEDPGKFEDNQFIGTGPFKFADRISGQYVKLVANEKYHGAKPHVNEVVLKVIKNKDSQVLSLKSGDADAIGGVSPAVAESLKGEKNIKVYNLPSTNGYELGFNFSNYPAGEVGFRKAMAHAIDREKICSVVFGGHAKPTYTTFLLPGVAYDFVNTATPKIDYDLDKCKNMLKSAGFVYQDGVLKDPAGKEISISILVSDVISKEMATIIKADWEKVGIKVSLKQVESSQANKEKHNNHVFFTGMPYLMHDDADDLNHFGSSSFFGQANWYDYKNPEYDELLKKLLTTDRAERVKVSHQLQDILAQDLPVVPVCSNDTIIAYRTDRFKGWEDVYPLYWNIVDIKQLLTIKPVK